jgi:hypothetical protein
MLPVLEPIYNMQEMQIEQTLIRLENAKVGETVELGEKTVQIENPKQIKSARAALQLMQKLKRNELANFQSIGKALAGLFPENNADVLLLRASGFHGLCRVYPVFARNERILEIYDAQWHCMGKVIGMIGKGEKYDLLKGSPMSYFAKSQFGTLADSLKSEALNVEVTEPVVSGPAVIVATLAIFA